RRCGDVDGVEELFKVEMAVLRVEQVLVNPNRLVSVLVECRVGGDAEASHVVCGLGVFRGLGKVLVVGFRAAAVFLELREGGNNGVFRVNTQSVASLRAG